MPVLAGFIELSPLGGLVNPYLAPALRALAVDYWPAYAVAMRIDFTGALVTAWPVSTTPRVVQGWRVQTFGADWYDRVHIRPSPLALGNILESQTVDLRVWNAWLVPRTLTGITGIEDGMSVTGPSALPVTFGALEEQVWQLGVTRDGPGIVNASLTWLFTGVPDPLLRVTGTRVVAWSWVPDWSEGITERLTWLTDVLASTSGAEQRRALRLAPRRVFEARAIVEGRDRSLLDLALAGWGGRIWALPIWPDVQQLASVIAIDSVAVPCATEGRDFRPGGLVMMIGASAFDVEAGEVLAVGPSSLTLRRPTQREWPAGARLYPARTAQLVQQPAVARRNDRLASVEMAFRISEPCDWPAATLPMYRGAPVLATRPDESEDLSTEYQRLLLELDNSTGQPLVTDTAGLGFAAQSHRWMLGGRAEQAAWRSLMYLLRGRQAAVWLPTHAEDLELQATAAESALSIDVAAVGYTRYAAGRVGRRDLRIELSDGTAVHRRVTGSIELSAQVERLAIDTGPGVTLRPAGAAGVHVNRISFMQLARLDQDELELQHVTDADGVARAQAVFRGVRDDLELAA